MDPQLARVLPLMPVLDLSDVAATRALNEATRMPFTGSDEHVDVSHIDVPGPEGAPPVVVRCYTPRGGRPGRPGLVYLHPGLFFGTLEMDHARCMSLCAGVGASVLSVRYRLAPEHLFPAAVEDCYAVLGWFAATAGRLDVDPDRIAVAGCSTGATLAAAVSLLARDRGGPRVAFQMLLQPALDDRLDTPSMRTFHDPGPSEAGRVGSAHIWRHYLGPDHGPVSPYAAPARATDLSGLPPAYVSTNEFDCLRDEGISYARRLQEAGVATELHHFPGTFHAFDLSVRTAAVARRALAEQVDVLRRALATPAAVRA